VVGAVGEVDVRVIWRGIRNVVAVYEVGSLLSLSLIMAAADALI
jgi:hypothetical protein